METCLGASVKRFLALLRDRRDINASRCDACNSHLIIEKGQSEDKAVSEMMTEPKDRNILGP